MALSVEAKEIARSFATSNKIPPDVFQARKITIFINGRNIRDIVAQVIRSMSEVTRKLLQIVQGIHDGTEWKLVISIALVAIDERVDGETPG